MATSWEFESMICEHNNGTASPNNAVALQWFQMENEQLVNLMFYAYLFQSRDFYVTSPHVNGNYIIRYRENIMTAAAMDEYNLMSYNSTITT